MFRRHAATPWPGRQGKATEHIDSKRSNGVSRKKTLMPLGRLVALTTIQINMFTLYIKTSGTCMNCNNNKQLTETRSVYGVQTYVVWAS